MSRSTEVGRGLAALLPHGDAARPVHDDSRDHGARPVSEVNGSLDLDVSGCESGIAAIYATLDAVVARFGLDDAAVVVEDAGLGRQVFRAGRRPLSDEDEELLAIGPGLYTEPALPAGTCDRSLVVALCTVALRLDLVRYDAWHDPLTGLFDRRSFDRLLEMAVARSTRYGWSFALVLLDLDDLKLLNDRDGHPAGDAALRRLGEHLRRALRFGDNAARIGGDEFALILPDTALDQVPTLLDRVRGDGEPGPTGSDAATLVPAFTAGAARCPDEATEVDALYRLADERLLAAKREKGRS